MRRSQWTSPFSVCTGQRTLLPVGQQRQNCQVVVTKQPWWWHRPVGKLVDILPSHATRVLRGHGGVRAAKRVMWRQPSCKLSLSPGQAESQVDTSWELESTCDSVWPGLACTCVELGWLAHILVEIKFSRKSKQVFYRLATQPKSTQLLLANEIEDSLF